MRVGSLGSLRKKTVQNENGSLARGKERDAKERRPSSRMSNTRGTTSRPSSSLGVPQIRTKTDRPSSRAESYVSRGMSPELSTPYSSKQTASTNQDADSRTPSPELPPTSIADPVTPVPLAKKKAAMGVLGLGTPAVQRWIEAGKGKAMEDRGKGDGKRVGFKEIGDAEDEEGPGAQTSAPDSQRNLSMQITPRRIPAAWAQTASLSQAAIPSPLRTLSASPSSASAAHNLLRTIMADVMYDYQRETKAEMTGIHLDLVRMGRGLRKELREVAEGGAGGLAEVERLKEENRLLREENERLRRGYSM